MTRQTSIDAYNQIKDEGLLNSLQFKVYDVLYHCGPLTQGEIWKNYFPNLQRHDVAPRVAELSRVGIVSAVGERKCSVTGRNCMLWDVTENLPQTFEKVKSKDQIIKELTQENTNLKKELARLKFENGQLF